MAALLAPTAWVLRPTATLLTPRACVPVPKATLPNPTLASFHRSPVALPARNAAFPGYHIIRVPAPVAGMAPTFSAPPATKLHVRAQLNRGRHGRPRQWSRSAAAARAWREGKGAAGTGAVSPAAAEVTRRDLRVDMERPSAGRGHDVQSEADRAVRIRERGAGDRRRIAAVAALIVGAFQPIDGVILRHDHRHDVAERLQLPAERAERLRRGRVREHGADHDRGGRNAVIANHFSKPPRRLVCMAPRPSVPSH